MLTRPTCCACCTGLEVEAARIMDAGAASNTRARWSSTQSRFIKFAMLMGYDRFVPTSPLLLILWCTQLHGEGKPWASIRQYVDGVNNLNVGFGYDKPWSGDYSYLAARFRRGLIALSIPSQARLPMTADVMRALWEVLPLTELASTCWCAAVLLFHLGVRIGNVLPPTSTRVAMVVKHDGVDIAAGGDKAVVTLPYTKTIRQPVHRFVFAAEAEQFCPMQALFSLTLAHGAHQGGGMPLVLRPDTGKPLTSAAFVAEMRRWMQLVPGLDGSRYSGVSFRKGTLQELARAGVSRPDIALHATHSSQQSQKHYITLDEGVQQVNAVHLAALFQ